ncbi:hypothetical protein CEXT_233091 [Caerostris extrusa]|uniref:Uncharacterized protein n=1 Tax=Caerostris extrusa TaxID=172846 RepID=A0AAV4XNY5_CAEEX|nr:hypothetical protein CEXT_233091 [Caerostris extrusa]
MPLTHSLTLLIPADEGGRKVEVGVMRMMMMTAMPASECETQRLVGNGTLFQLPLHFGPNCDTDQLGVNFVGGDGGGGWAYDSSLSLSLSIYLSLSPTPQG